MASIEVDASDLRRLSAGLAAVPDDVLEDGHQVVKRGALNVKNGWAQRWGGLAHAPSLPAAVSYDTAVLGDVIEAEIGPDKERRQGALGNLLEFGSVNNAPRPGGLPALDAEAPAFARYAEQLAVDVLERHL